MLGPRGAHATGKHLQYLTVQNRIPLFISLSLLCAGGRLALIGYPDELSDYRLDGMACITSVSINHGIVIDLAHAILS